MIKVIRNDSVEQYSVEEVGRKMVGQKAMGLLKIPMSWRLPFFVLDKNISETFIHLNDDDKKIFCMKVSLKIKECTKDFSMLNDRIIMRSSGEEEGMNERGKYESLECRIEEVHNSLYQMLHGLEKQGDAPIAYIVQPYVERKIFGHLSNERRISQFARDWKVEYENMDKEPYSIGVRKWRKIYSCEELMQDQLKCTDENGLKTKLREVAFYYTQIKKGKRFHFEFVWNGNRIYLVQLDIEMEADDAKNPMEYNIKVSETDKLGDMEEFRLIRQEDARYFKKVRNTLMYQRIGLTTAPLYILDNMTIISEMSQGMFRESIKKDLLRFDGKSIVIRTDVAVDGEDGVQLLPRSNELRNYEDVVEWCKQNLCRILDYSKAVVLIHIFIPAISAAFAYAEPHSRVVTIQSLWGLPEGLYYNAHDTFLLDTGTKNIGHINESKVVINNIVKDYKEFYIAPDEDGKWTEKKAKPPYDWKESITNDQAKKIAIGSRLIAEKEEKAVSIMWFVGIDEDYYKTDCIPWFHERYGNNTFSHEIYKKKYYSEKEVVISSEEDLKKYETVDHIRTITIHPKDDKTLRNRGFIDKVGSFAKERGLTIFLEGTILAHPVYALAAKGVKIILAKKNKELIEKNNFNKLVRDKIPDKIIGNMEEIICYKATGYILVRYLKEKLVEEVFEICDSVNENDMITEIVDAYEVLFAMHKRINAVRDYIDIKRERMLWDKNEGNEVMSIKNINLLSGKYEKQYACDYGWINFEIEREHQCLELEITISSKKSDFENSHQKECAWKYMIVDHAYQILDSTNREELLSECDKLLYQLEEKLTEVDVSKEQFEEIRRNKIDRNGGFENGYILQGTQMRTEAQKMEYELSLPFEDAPEEYSELYGLLFDPVTYLDYREGENKELIIRIKYPLCLNVWHNEFISNKVSEYFGINSTLRIEMKRNKMSYSFGIYLLRETYEQISFEMI